MRITKEDAHRLITDLPKYYEVLKEEDLVNKNGKLLRIPAIEVKEVVLGMIEVNKKVTVAFVSPKDNRLKILLMDQDATKKAIEFWYSYVKTRRKSLAELSIYMDVNKILEERSKIDIHKIVEDLNVLNKKLDKLTIDFEPVDVTYLSEKANMRINEEVKKASNNKYEVIVEEDASGRVLSYISPINDERGVFILNMVYSEDVRDLLKIISLTDSLQKEFSRLIYNNDTKVTVDYIMSVEPTRANIFHQTLLKSITALDKIRERYEKDIKECTDVILKIRAEYEVDPEF